VIALRTYAENEVRAAQEFVAFPERDQKSTLPVFADQKFFHGPPCGPAVSEKRGKLEAVRKCIADLELLSFPSGIEFNPIKSVQPVNWGVSGPEIAGAARE
jgi:hypothetical protein